MKHLLIDLIHLEVEWSDQNHAEEGYIGHLKKHFWQNMVSNKFPKRLWNYGLVRHDGILSRIARGKMGQTALSK